MPLYTFSCANGHSHDALVGRDSASRPCPQCGLFADRESVYRIGVAGFTIAPLNERTYDIKPYMEATAELAYRHDRAKDASQNPHLASPPLYQMAKAKAQKLIKAGVKDSGDVRLMS